MTLSQQKQLIPKEYAARVTKMQDDLRSLSLCTKAEQEIELSAKNMAKINGIIAQVDESGAAISKLGEQFSSMHHSHINETVTHGFHLAGFFMSVFNFVRIPAIYLIAYLTNQKIPLTLGNNARWLHATILLGLAVVALSVPALAPIIAFVGAGLSLGVSVFMLGKKLYERYQLGRELKNITQAITTADEAMELLHQQVFSLNEMLKTVDNDDAFVMVSEHIALLEKAYKTQKAGLVELHQHQRLTQEKINVLNDYFMFDKSLAVAFASASVLGLVVSLFLPGMGLGIVAGVGIAAASYALLRIITPFIVQLVRRLSQTKDVSPEDEQVDQGYSCGSSFRILEALDAVDGLTTTAAEQQEAAPSPTAPLINHAGDERVTASVESESDHAPASSSVQSSINNAGDGQIMASVEPESDYESMFTHSHA